MFGKKLREARETRNLSQDATGAAVGVSRETIKRIELGQTAAPDLVPRLAAALRAPDLLVAYCEDCPVCSALVPVRFPTLTNVPTHPVAILQKIAEECREGAVKAEDAIPFLDFLDWVDRPEAVTHVVGLLEELRDIEVGIRVLYEALFLHGTLPLAVLYGVQERQARKCERRGYCKKSGPSTDGPSGARAGLLHPEGEAA